MAGLKSYTCSKCGGILSVDREQDVLDCPFCGTQFDYVEFHSGDLLIKSSKAEEDKLSKDAQRGVIDVNDDRFTYMWTELSSKTKRYEKTGTDIDKEFKDLLNDFLKTDRELFNYKFSS